MTSIPSRWASRILATSLQFALVCSSLPAQQATDYTFRVQSELVLVNVTVRDKNGHFVRGLKPQDFTILEDNKPQKVDSFDVEDVDAVATQDVAQAKALPSPLSQPASPAGAAPPAAGAQNQNQFKDRRVIVLFFDLSAMEPDEIDRAVTSAQHYVDTQMAQQIWSQLFRWEARCW
jgi:VWFA-related protein